MRALFIQLANDTWQCREREASRVNSVHVNVSKYAKIVCAVQLDWIALMLRCEQERTSESEK